MERPGGAGATAWREEGEWTRLKHEANCAGIHTRRYEMRARKSRLEIVQRDFVRDVGDGEPGGDVSAILVPKQMIRAQTDVENMARSDTRRIVIVVRRALSRYLQTGRAESRWRSCGRSRAPD